MFYIFKKGMKKSGKRMNKVSPINFLTISQNCSLVSRKMSGTQSESVLWLILVGRDRIREGRSLDVCREGPWVFSVASGRRKVYW